MTQLTSLADVTTDEISFGKLKFSLVKCRIGEFNVGRNDIKWGISAYKT